MSYFLAPAEVTAAPIISNERRKRLKLASVLSVACSVLLVEFGPLTLDLVPAMVHNTFHGMGNVFYVSCGFQIF
ncbi:MAG: hypothetical protein ACM3NT_01930 [Methylocystaceae bacterium]